MIPKPTSQITETEAKFTVADKAVFRKLSLLSKISDCELHSKQIKIVRDCYYDTPQRHILAANLAFRYRKTGKQAEVCLKGLGGVQDNIHYRTELTAAMPARFRRKAWQATPVYKKAQEIIGAGALRKLFCLKQIRTVFKINCQGQDVAILSLDRVQLAIEGRKQTWFELEIEQTGAGSPADVARMAACFQDEWQLSPQPLSKFERGLRLLDGLTRPVEPASVEPAAVIPGPPAPAPAEPSPVEPAAVIPGPPAPAAPDLHRDDSMAVAARKILGYHFEQMRFFEATVHLDKDIEGVHQMRVATRKMRAALRLFGPYLKARHRRQLRNGLRRTARTLGKIRDLDVFWENVQRACAGSRATLRPEDLSPLYKAWRAERESHLPAMLNYLHSKTYRRFKRDFQAMLHDTPVTGAAAARKPVPHRLRHIVPVLLYQQLARIHAYDDLIAGGNISSRQLHNLRIEFKQLRYSLDFFSPILNDRNVPLLKLCKQVQTHLGDLNDAVAAIAHLKIFLRWGSWQKPARPPKSFPAKIVIAPGVQVWLDMQRVRKARLQTTFPHIWKRTQSLKFRQMFANNIKTL